MTLNKKIDNYKTLSITFRVKSKLKFYYFTCKSCLKLQFFSDFCSKFQVYFIISQFKVFQIKLSNYMFFKVFPGFQVFGNPVILFIFLKTTSFDCTSTPFKLSFNVQLFTIKRIIFHRIFKLLLSGLLNLKKTCLSHRSLS